MTIPHLQKYYYGLDKEISEENIKSFDTQDYYHRVFIDETIENKNSVYFSMFNNHKCLIFNAIENPVNFFFEFCSSEIHFVNYGGLLHNLSLVGAVINFSDKSKPLILKAGKQKNISNIIREDEETILICQLAENCEKRFCVSDSKFKKNECDFLTDVFKDEIFNYRNIYIYVKCKNIYNKTFYFKISVEKHGNYFIPNTKRVRFFCRLFFTKPYIKIRQKL